MSYDGYKNSPANHQRCMDYLEEHGYLALGSGHSVITQQTGNCDGTKYMHTEITDVTEVQLGELRQFFGERISKKCSHRTGRNRYFVMINHYEKESR